MVKFNTTQNKCKKPFKFCNYWTNHPDFLEVVQKCWDTQVKRVPMYILYCKLKALKKELKKLNKSQFGAIRDRVTQAKSHLDNAQANLLHNPHNASFCLEEKGCLCNYVTLSNSEEAFLRQKSRINWLKLGDQNSGFFHKAVRIRNSFNEISNISYSNGNLLSNEGDVKREAVGHFQKLLSTATHDLEDSIPILNSLEGFKWSDEHLAHLNQ